MISLIARLLLLAGGAVASWLVARSDPSFSSVQMTAALVLFGLAVVAVAIWPAAWTEKLNGLMKRR